MERKPISFLDFPPKVRLRVYQYAGIISGEVLLLGPRSERSDWSQAWMEEQFGLVASLLRTCKAIHAEVQSFLYANNGIAVLNEHVESGLNIVSRMTPDQCRSLRDLYVQLHVEGSYDSLTPGHIAAWQTTARHILSHVHPRSLTLHLMCDTGDSLETHAVLEPLLELPGTLKACELRLASRRDHRLISFAKEAAARVEARDDTTTYSKSFRFLDLPTELRIEILRYTDLVTPYNQVEWNSEQGFHVLDPAYDCYVGDSLGEPFHDNAFIQDSESYLEGDIQNPVNGKLHRACRFFRCKTKSPFEAGDFCGRRRSAYSPVCRCWIPPAPLMLVCRTMYEDAIRTLYSYNRIIITPPGGRFDLCLGPNYLPSRLEAARFITRHMYPHVLQHLRHLEIVFPELDPSFCPETSSPFYLDWRFAIDHLKWHGNLHGLTFTIHISSDSASRDPWLRYVNKRFKQGETTETECMLRPYTQLITPLQNLREMQGLFIHLQWLWYWKSYENLFWIDWDVEGRLRQRPRKVHRAFEDLLEWFVMGKDYDSFAIGKAEEQPSEWLKRELRLRYIRTDPYFYGI
ncbi:hypothetical protein F4801DRAFT_585343 [Xylaria longipes]|nr:hypothetical protein F4801DRAFT_585343 [Xylaria longipes]